MTEDPGPVQALLVASRFVAPDDLPSLVADHALALGAADAVVYLADLDQVVLVPLPRPGRTMPASASIDATMVGRSFRSVEVIETTEPSGDRRLLVPIVDGAERLGVLELTITGAHPVDRHEVMAFAGLVAELVLTKGAYGDFFEVTRRQRPNTVAAELLWRLLPPLTFAADELVIAAACMPTADLGGDAFDYSVGRRHAHVALFDGMGHGLGAGLLASVAIAANRRARRLGFGLGAIAADIGAAVEGQFPDRQFVTGTIGSLDRWSGRFDWCVAGHPPPLLVRGGRAVKSLDRGVGMPFGIGPASAVFGEQLEPGDRLLLYTDGVTEARTGAGELFDVDRLVDLVRQIGGDDPPPETMRRLMRAIEDHNDGPMRDDATIVLVEWRGPGPGQTQPDVPTH